MKFNYEPRPLWFLRPAKKTKYLPDFVLEKQALIIEAKGRFDTADRQKHLLIQEQYPALDVRFVFSNPGAKISARSKTTYANWCEKYGFMYAKGTIPPEWLNHKPSTEQRKAMENYLSGT